MLLSVESLRPRGTFVGSLFISPALRMNFSFITYFFVWGLLMGVFDTVIGGGS